MPRLSTRRAATVTVAGLTACAATLVTAPAALAAPAPLPTPVLSDTTVVPGQPFTVTFTGCGPDAVGSLPDADGSLPLVWYEITNGENVTDTNDAHANADGIVTFDESFQPGTAPGEYTIEGVCDHFYRVQFFPPVTVTVAEPAPTPPSQPTGPEKGDEAKAKAKAFVLAKAKALAKAKGWTKEDAEAKAKALAKVLAKAKAKAKARG